MSEGWPSRLAGNHRGPVAVSPRRLPRETQRIVLCDSRGSRVRGDFRGRLVGLAYHRQKRNPNSVNGQSPGSSVS